MKRFLAALAALWMLLVAHPATAEKMLFVIKTRTSYGDKSNSDARTHLLQRMEVQKTAETLGIDGDFFFDYQVPTKNALTSNHNGVQYGGTVIVGARFGTALSGLCYEDSLTLYSVWDGNSGRPTNAQRRPILFMCVPNVSGNNSALLTYSTAGSPPACSTGTALSISTFASIGAGGQVRSAFLAGSSMTWKEWDCIYPVPRLSTAPPGILRTIVGFKITPANTYVSGGDYRCGDDCDDVGSTIQTTSDSLGILWARYIDSAPTSRKQAMFFCWPTANTAFGGGTYSQAAMAMGLAALDSAAGKTMIGQRPGWKPVEMALVIGRGFSESTPNTAPTPPSNYGGIARTGGAGGNAPDSVRIKATLDLMGAWGVPWTVTACPDSVAINKGFLSWWSRLKSVQYAVEVTNGTWTGAKLNSTSKFATNDPFGHLSARAIGYYGNPMAADDTTMQALAKFAKDRIDSVTGAASRAIFPAHYDGIPINFALRKLPNIDTYNMALWTAGYRVVVFAPDMANSNPSMTWGRKGQLTQSDWATDNYSFGSAEVSYPVFTDSTARTKIGRITHVMCPTGLIAEYPSSNLVMNHNAANDFIQSVFTGIGLSQDYQNYYHSFRQPRRIFRVEAYSLGAQSAVDNPNRYGYWQMKQVVMSMKALNQIAGRTVVKFVMAGDL